ncbi:MAG: hypothetical protein UT05_C0015G0007 [Parcubacteria group bacterium GW2011_GWF2_38_76]|nr:MAG: hypothetical protein UT05_C0015G0007 [Parcubacteria group bacterium GW2011_GWF2_38_76]
MNFYLLDTVSITEIQNKDKNFFTSNFYRDNCFVPEEIVFELESPQNEYLLDKLKKKTYPISSEILKYLPIVMGEMNLDNVVIDLYQNKGNGDVFCLAIAFCENSKNQDKLLPDDWLIVSNDLGLAKLAKTLGVRVINSREFELII